MLSRRIEPCLVLAAALLLAPLRGAEPAGPHAPPLPDGPEDDDAELRSVDDVPSAPLEEGVYLQSGDLKILLTAVKRVEDVYFAAQKKDNPKFELPPEVLTGVRREIAMQLLQNALLERHAADHKLTAPKADLEKEIGDLKAALTERGSSYAEMLAETAQTDEDFQRFWGAKLAIEQDLAKAVSDEAVNQEWAKTKDTLPLRRVAHILFMYQGAQGAEKAQPPVTRTKAEAQAAAEDALKKLKAGADFAALAKEVSDCPSKKDGGDLDFFPLKGDGAMDPAFGAAAYTLAKVEDLSGVVETPFGFHVLKLTANREDEYRQNLRRELVSEKFDKIMGQLMTECMSRAKFNEKLVPPPPAPPAGPQVPMLPETK